MEDNKKSTWEKIFSESDQYFKCYQDYKLSLTAKMSLISSAVNMMSGLNFVGFYLKIDEENLEIGPFQSNHLPCPRIKIGNGVCGSCWKNLKTEIVEDVSKIENYIACDDVTQSEIVIPYLDKEGNFVGVLDIDSPILNNFDSIDEHYLKKILELLNN